MIFVVNRILGNNEVIILTCKIILGMLIWGAKKIVDLADFIMELKVRLPNMEGYDSGKTVNIVGKRLLVFNFLLPYRCYV